LTWINRGLERADEMIVLAAELLLKAELEKQKADRRIETPKNSRRSKLGPYLGHVDRRARHGFANGILTGDRHQ
jgi:hypothetical protein